MKIKFWGTRGSIPVPGKNTLKYGGNTSCIEIYKGGNEITILDAGSGIRELGLKILDNPQIKKINILISHFHWDHIQGLPFFTPIYKSDYEINFFTSNKIIPNENILDILMQPLVFPVTKAVLKAKINFIEMKKGKNIQLKDFEISAVNSHHSQGTVSYKVKTNKINFVYMTDNEIYYDAEKNEPELRKVTELNKELISFCNGSDFLVHDSMYALEDYKRKIGWGHSNNISAALLAEAAGVDNLVLFHYDPQYTDDKIDTMYSETKSFLLKKEASVTCIASTEDLEIKI